MHIRLFLFLSFSFLSFTTSPAQNTEFSGENAYTILRTLVLEIGPRPMGSPAEQKALAFAISKFKEYGCDTSYIMAMTVAGGVNTTSGIAIGVKKGRSNRIIVIGGHIDSAGPDIPGANDDGSGTACVIELARVLCKRENESTVMFCCWGGEEEGLRGSTHFVNNFKNLDSVALMFQIDMADGAGKLQADPDGGKASAPAWLVKSAFDIFYGELHYDRLIYPTIAASWNLAVGGATGSDHEAFIDNDIPAIDFTSDVTFPIHTPQDNLENFTPGGLKRSGDLVLKLFEKYDGGVPSRTTEKYQIIQFGSSLIVVPYFILWMFIAGAILVGIAAFVIARKRRSEVDPANKIKWSRFKLLGASFIIQVFAWNSETVVGLIRGYRFPWVNNVFGFQIFEMLFGLLGLWFVLQAVHRYRLSKEEFVFVRLAIVPLFILTLLSSYFTPELGMYLAAALLCMAVAIIVQTNILKFVFYSLAVLIAYKLIFFDEIGLFQRLISQNRISELWQKALFQLAFIIAFTGFSLPFVYGFAAVYRGSKADVLWLNRFRGRRGLVAVSLAIIVVGGYLLGQPVYGKLWYNSTRVEQHFTIGDDSSSLVIKGSEYLNGLRGSINGRDTLLTGKSNYASLELSTGSEVSWSNVQRTARDPMKINDTSWNVERKVVIHSQFRPLRVDVTFESAVPFEIATSWAHDAWVADPSDRETERRKHLVWHAFPDTQLVIPVTITARDTQRISEEIRITFDSLSYPVHLQREFTNLIYRTYVVSRDTFSVKNISHKPGSLAQWQ